MEQHPVPQNVTTFQFRLIGDMTLKQFGYLAGGAILAYICYKLPLPLFLNWPLAILSAVAGFGFAFVPIEERPMDVWVLSFFKSIYSPTQYVWSKRPPAAPTTPPPPAASTDRRGNIVQSLYVAPSPLPTAASKRKGPFDWFFDMFMPAPKINQPMVHSAPTAAAPAMDFTPPPAVKTREEINSPPPPPPPQPDIQKQFADLQEEHARVAQELARFRAQSVPTPPAPLPTSGTYVATPASRSGPSVRIITPDRAVGVGLPRLTTFANVVTGIVKDGDQNLLPGVLVTVKDNEGMPLRALKTNRLGQFAASTPLPNGTYVIEIEDPRLRYAFDRAQVTLNGTLVPALEIFAKSQKEISRAKLEKEIFGTKNE